MSLSQAKKWILMEESVLESKTGAEETMGKTKENSRHLKLQDSTNLLTAFWSYEGRGNTLK